MPILKSQSDVVNSKLLLFLWFLGYNCWKVPKRCWWWDITSTPNCWREMKYWRRWWWWRWFEIFLSQLPSSNANIPIVGLFDFLANSFKSSVYSKHWHCRIIFKQFILNFISLAKLLYHLKKLDLVTQLQLIFADVNTFYVLRELHRTMYLYLFISSDDC